jgi:hypothetical protein
LSTTEAALRWVVKFVDQLNGASRPSTQPTLPHFVHLRWAQMSGQGNSGRRSSGIVAECQHRGPRVLGRRPDAIDQDGFEAGSFRSRWTRQYGIGSGAPDASGIPTIHPHSRRHPKLPLSRIAPIFPALRKCDSEQARAEQHKAGCGYSEEPIGPKVMIAHRHHLSLGNSDHRLDYRRLLAQNDCHVAQSKGFPADPKNGI